MECSFVKRLVLAGLGLCKTLFIFIWTSSTVVFLRRLRAGSTDRMISCMWMDLGARAKFKHGGVEGTLAEVDDSVLVERVLFTKVGWITGGYTCRRFCWSSSNAVGVRYRRSPVLQGWKVAGKREWK